MSRARDLADSADLNFDSNTLAIDTANNRVGIGTASPSTDLEVAGSKIKITNASGGAQFQGSANGGGMYFDSIGSTTDIIFRQSGSFTERMRIDSAGRVTMPYQPLARAACSSTITSVAKIPLNAHNLSNGGLSIDNTNNRMIVPVDGYYVVGFSHLVELANSNVAIRHNGSDISNGRSQSVDGANNEMSTHTIVNLSANDYIEFWVVAGRIHNNASYNSMYCYLLG